MEYIHYLEIILLLLFIFLTQKVWRLAQESEFSEGAQWNYHEKRHKM